MPSSKNQTSITLVLFLAAVCLILPAQPAGALEMPSFFSNYMVLQRDMPIPVWGWGAPGETVTVTFGSTRAEAVAEADGRWMATLPATPAGGPYTMTIVGNETITIEEILVGEVWLCSGQSNMEMGLGVIKNAEDDLANADYPDIRLFHVKNHTSSGCAQRDIKDGRWLYCLTRNIKKNGWGGFSAVGYFFGRKIHKELNVPVGLIDSSWGGSMIEPWTPLEGFEQVPALSDFAEQIRTASDTYREHLLEMLEHYQQWVPQARQAVEHHLDIPSPPDWPKLPLENRGQPTCIYNGMIHPFVPFAIRGAIWYQGESNCIKKDGMQYYEKMKALIQGWRTVWNQGDFPFYYVQLAPFDYNSTKVIDDPTELARFWEAQTASLSIPNTGMAVTTDLVDDLKDIHPINKKDVGERLALWALAKTYGFDDIVYSGPLYQSMAVEGDTIRVRFDHTADGLASRDDKALTWFQIAGKDKVFYDAEAEITPDRLSVLLHSPSVAEPVAVRFGRDQLAQPNLINSAGLPAGPFRTDNW